MQQITDKDFEAEVLRAELPALVKFTASWCAPCKQLAPILEDVARELSGKVKVLAVDIDQSPMVSQAFQVQSVPMLVLVYQGQLAGHLMGVVTKQQILEMVKPVLPASASEVKPQELAQGIQAGRAVPVDIRDASSYGRYRIPTAIHIAADDLASRAPELAPADGRLRVLYDRSTDRAKEFAETLRNEGVEVGFLEGGFLHWEADGLEVDRG